MNRQERVFSLKEIQIWCSLRFIRGCLVTGLHKQVQKSKLTNDRFFGTQLVPLLNRHLLKKETFHKQQKQVQRFNQKVEITKRNRSCCSKRIVMQRRYCC